MGNYFTVDLEKNFAKNEEFLAMKTKAGMERFKQMQNEMTEKQMALGIARSRDFTMWFTAFYLTTLAGLLAGYRKTKRPFLLAPLMPLTFIELYNLDSSYGNKMYRVRSEAERILAHEADKLKLPNHLSTQESLDLALKKKNDRKKNNLQPTEHSRLNLED